MAAEKKAVETQLAFVQKELEEKEEKFDVSQRTIESFQQKFEEIGVRKNIFGKYCPFNHRFIIDNCFLIIFCS